MVSRGLAWFMLVLFVSGCVSPSMTRPASMPVLAGAQRARFSTTASPEVVRANACALTGTFQAGALTRSWTVTAGEVRCWSRHDADSIPLHVYMGEDLRSVVLEAAADDVPEETLRDAVSSTGLSLKDAIKRAEDARETLAENKLAENKNGGHGQGAAIAAAATGGGLAVVAVVVIVVVVVGAVIAGFAALLSAFGKAFH